MPRSVLFLLPYPLHRAPSQRFRVEAFFQHLRDNKIDFDSHVFLNEKAWSVLYKKGSFIRKLWAVIWGFILRAQVVLFKSHRYEYIFIHREAAPLGPPFFEWWLAKIANKKIIYDFDDAIWIPNVTAGNHIARLVKCFWKVSYICKWAYKVSAGNEFLAAFARRSIERVHIVPTCVDTVSRFNQLKLQSEELPVIGWTGSHSTLKYLDSVLPVLRKLGEKYRFTFLVICNQAPHFDFPGLKFLPWEESSEIEDLLQMNIGIMPLQQDAWSEGKCGFKIIQYLSLGIPAVASPVGVNREIISEGVNGFLCDTDDKWFAALEALMLQPALRTAFGENGRKTVEARYSIQAHSGNFLSLFS